MSAEMEAERGKVEGKNSSFIDLVIGLLNKENYCSDVVTHPCDLSTGVWEGGIKLFKACMLKNSAMLLKTH